MLGRSKASGQRSASPRTGRQRRGVGLGILPTALLAEWRFDDGSGAVLRDSSGNGYHGALPGGANTPTWAGGGLSFDGSNDYANLYSAGLAAAFSGQEVTIEVVARVSGAGVWTDGTQRHLFEFQVGPTDLVRARRPLTTNNTVSLLYNAGGTLKVVNATVSLTDAVYYALTASKSADQMRAYLSGAQVGSTQTALGTFTGSLNSATTVAGAAGATGAAPWSGSIHYLIVRSAALSAAQIADNYARIKAILATRGVTVA